MKILTILGARPQFIKAGNISRNILNFRNIKEVIVHTGQHYDDNMSDIFFEELNIPTPKYFLGIGAESNSSMTGKMIVAIEKIALEELPDWILVYGDTNSTLAGALVASKLNIKLAHVEAGLRSYNMDMAEEINRVLTDRVSSILFCPTNNALANLKAEGYPFKLKNNRKQLITNVGDVMLDSCIFYKNLAKKPNITKNFTHNSNDFALCTIHRAENVDDEIKLKNIFGALNEIAKHRNVILPIHPRTKKKIDSTKYEIKNINIIEPASYLEMIWLLDNCDLVITDSGGLQKEACFFKKNCITLREETEWNELVDYNVNTLAGTKKKDIIDSYKNHKDFDFKESILKVYGDGKAGTKIIKTLLDY